MSSNSSRTAQQAASALRGVSPSQVAAMATLEAEDPATLSALLSAVIGATASDHPDVQEHAAVIVAAVYAGTPGEGYGRTRHAALRARRLSIRLVESMTAEDTYGTAEDADALLYGADAPADAVAMPDAVPADARLRVTYSDLVETVAGDVARRDPVAGTGLRRAVDDWRAHDGDTCEDCAGTVGRRVTLTGITAHREHWGREDAAYHRAYRATRAALRAVPGHGDTATPDAPALPAWDALAALTGDAAPMARRSHGRNSTAHGDITPGTLSAPYSSLRHPRAVAVTVRTVERVTVPARTVEQGAAQWEARASAAWERASDRRDTVRAALAAGSMFGDAAAWLAADAAHGDAVRAERRAHAVMLAAQVAPARRAVTVDAAHYSAVRVTVPGAALPFPTLDAVEHNGSPRVLSEAERETVARPRPARTVVPAPDGEGGTAPMADTRRDGGAGPRPRPRKGARSGQTGPTVPTRGRRAAQVDDGAARAAVAAVRARSGEAGSRDALPVVRRLAR